MARTPKDIIRLPLKDNPIGKGLLLTTLALLSLGVVMVHSASASVARQGPWYARLDVRQTLFAVAAVMVLAFGWLIDYRRLGGGYGVRAGTDEKTRFPVFPAVLLGVALICGLLVFHPAIGYAVGGRCRWIRVGPPKYQIGFQPSELIKLLLVIFLAAWLARRGERIRSFRRTFLPGIGLLCVCLAVVVTQDFGTAVLIAISAMAVMLLAGVPLVYLAGLAAAGAGAGWLFVVQSPQRLARITAMLDPWSQTNPSAYQPRQSLLSILSGGYFGKGLGRGMIKRGFLPEGSTDFIFSTFCEEWGLVGAILLMALLLMWMWMARRATAGASDRFGLILCGSLGFLIAIQAVFHLAVDLVAAPPTGMGMPFISAGGTSLLAAVVATAMMVSVTAHRREGEKTVSRYG